MMLALVLLGTWLAIGILAVIVNVLSSPVDDPPYRESYEKESNQAVMGFAVLLGLFGMVAALLKWFSRAAATAKKEKRRVAEEMERELAKARAEVEELLKTKRGA